MVYAALLLALRTCYRTDILCTRKRVRVRMEAAMQRMRGHDRVLVGSSTIERLCLNSSVWCNAGVGSSTTVELLPALEALATRPDHAIVYVGVNDLIRDTDMAAAGARIRRICSLFDRAVYVPIIESPLLAAGGPVWTEAIATLNRGVAEWAARQSSVDVVTLPRWEPNDFVWDGLHLSASGNEKLLWALKPFLSAA